MVRTFAFGLVLIPGLAHADICDYRPSQLIGAGGTGGAIATGGAVAAAGAGAKAAGFYTLTHAVTGATMLGSVAGGASAAGTVGIMGGTAGGIGTVAAIVMAPATIIVAGVTAGGVALYEGGCYFAVERINDPAVISEVVENIAKNADPEYLRLTAAGDEVILLLAKSHDDEGRAVDWDRFEVSRLYIEDGMLKHRDWGPNTQIGRVGIIAPEKPE